MNQRNVLKTIGAVALTGTASANPPIGANVINTILEGARLEGSFDIPHEVYDPIEMVRAFGGKVFLDGVEVKQCTYANSRMGVVWTLDVFGDGLAHATRKADGGWWCPNDFPGRHVECAVGNVLRERRIGKVEVFAGPISSVPTWRKKLVTEFFFDGNAMKGVVVDVTTP